MEGFIEKFRSLCGGSKELAWLIAVNVAVSIAVWIAGIVMAILHIDAHYLRQWLVLPSSFSLFAVRPWTMLTYMFTQFSVLHLLFNVLWLFWFGRMLLMKVPSRRLPGGYLCGGLAGGAAYLAACACGVPAGAYLCGASASVLAIMCMVAVTIPDYELNLFIVGRVRMKWFAIVCVALTLVGTAGSQAATTAHVGGILSGVICGLKWRGASGKTEETIKNVYSEFRRKMHRMRPKDAESALKAMQGRLSDHDRLDQLLDKIRLSGYLSLTESERLELDALSRRIKN